MSESGGMTTRVDVAALAEEIDARVKALARPTTTPIRLVRQEYSRRLRDASGADVLALADALAGTLVDRHRWVAYELLYHHPAGLSTLGAEQVTRLGGRLDSWYAADAFGRYISGPAWQRGLVGDEVVRGWAASPDRWWRRAALVSTVPLNLRAAGGSGDTARTLDICRRLVDDRDDMVVKALSWALRALVAWDAEAVRAFVDDHPVAARVRREVTSKLETGVKNRRPGRRTRRGGCPRARPAGRPHGAP
jgi:3-methyladenine DNA glycosylase AlkD